MEQPIPAVVTCRSAKHDHAPVMRICLLLNEDEQRRVRLLEEALAKVFAVARMRDPQALDPLSDNNDPVLILRLGHKAIQLARWNRAARAVCPVCLDRRCRRSESARTRFDEHHEASDGLPLPQFAIDTIMSLGQLLDQCSDDCGFDLDLEALRWRRFWLEPDSDCPHCARVAEEAHGGRSMRLLSRQKRGSHSYRMAPADSLPLRTERSLNGTCGFLGVGGSRNDFQPFAARMQGAFYDGARSISWGANSTTYARALSVGLCEAFERHAGVALRGKRNVITGTLRELGELALDPRDCGVYDSQYYEAHKSLEPFSDEMRIRWVEGYSITENRPVLVPLQVAFYGMALGPDEPRFVFESSNGCATGTCLEEAVFFGMLEVIERDSFMLHWLASLSATQVDLDSVASPPLQILLARLRLAGYEVHVLDARLDIKIPTIIAVVRRRDCGYGTFVVTAASHFDPKAAILASVSDAAVRQSGFAKRTMRLEKKLRAALRDFSLIRTISDHGDLYGLPEAARQTAFLTEGATVSYAQLFEAWEHERAQSLDLRNDIDHLVSALAGAGLRQLIIVDQTSPEELRIGLRTVKVLIPGALPIDFGYGRCRASGLSRLATIASRQGRSPHHNQWPHPFA